MPVGFEVDVMSGAGDVILGAEDVLPGLAGDAGEAVQPAKTMAAIAKIEKRNKLNFFMLDLQFSKFVGFPVIYNEKTRKKSAIFCDFP